MLSKNKAIRNKTNKIIFLCYKVFLNTIYYTISNTILIFYTIYHKHVNYSLICWMFEDFLDLLGELCGLVEYNELYILNASTSMT